MTGEHSARMRAVAQRDTDVEIKLRRALWRASLRYRVNERVATTRPDIVFRRARVAVFVDGCFWHGCPKHYVAPVGNAEFWRVKLERNRARDARDTESLRTAHWRVLRYWQCDINHDLDRVVELIRMAVGEGKT